MSRTVRAFGDLVVCSIFIASITASAWPFFTGVAGLDGKRHHLARHGRGQARPPSAWASPAVGQQASIGQLRGALRAKMRGLATAVCK